MIFNADSSNQALEVCFQKSVTKRTINHINRFQFKNI